MTCKIEVLFTPAETRALRQRDLSQSVCVVIDVLRATSTMVTALGNGAKAVIPVEEISEALALRSRQPDLLLAGERGGLRITGALTGGAGFDLGNSPREFTPGKIAGRIIVSSTTNGTRALRACAEARTTLAGSLLNLSATAGWILHNVPEHLLLVCAGTGDNASLEDVLTAGAFCDRLRAHLPEGPMPDSAVMAQKLYLGERDNLPAALRRSENGARLWANPDLREDVEFCLRADAYPLVAVLQKHGAVTKLT